MPTKNFQTGNDVTQIKSNHSVKDFYHKNLFRKIYTVVIIGLIGVNVFSLLKYQTFADELVEAPVQEQGKVVTDMGSETVADLSASVEDDTLKVADVDHSKDIIIQATATETDQTLIINKYFANDYVVDWGDGSPVETVSSQCSHIYSTEGTKTITLSLTGTATRWTFLGAVTPLVPKNGTTTIGVVITSMPSLADGFGFSAITPGNNFFNFFNYDGALTSLPEGSFDTSNITTAGDSFFYCFNNNGALTSLPELSFDTSNITTAGDYFFGDFNRNGALTSLPELSFDTSKITIAERDFFDGFNGYGALTSLPEGSFDTSSITQAGNNFFANFNYDGALTALPEGSFDTSSITRAGNNFFASFNSDGAITALPEGSFRTENIETHGYGFFMDSNRLGAITCPNSQKLYRLRCLSEEESGVYYRSGYIELTDGDETIYIKDRNQGATKVANTSDENYASLYNGNELGLPYYYSDEDNIASFGDYYYRGNNVGATWNELGINWNNCYSYAGTICVVNEDDKLAMVSNGFGTGKVGEDDTGWEKDSDKGNPCNADEGEYLPTVSDWQKAMSIWGKTHWQDYDDNENYAGPANLATYGRISLEDMTDFYGDLLIPSAGIITTELDYYNWSPVGYDWDNQIYFNEVGSENLWTARDGDKIGYMGRGSEEYIGGGYGNTALIWRNPEDENVYPYGDDNSVAMPVRCFIDPDYVNPQVLVITLMSDNRVYKELNVVKGNTLAEPTAPSKSNYTFDGWYTEDGEKYNFDNPFTEDMTLYAKWTEKSSSGGYSGGGGGSSSKPDKSHGSTDDNKETMDTKKDEPKVEEPKKEPEQPSQGKTLDTTSPSKETFNAHQWAYSNGLTKYRTASEARMDDPLNRSEMAKISSIFATQFLDKVPNEKKKEFCSQYPDLWKVTSDMEAFIIESCELGYMGYESNGIDALERFRPYTPVTVAEAATILSRIVWGNDNAMNGKDWYKGHLYATYNHGLIDDIKDPTKRSISRREAYTMLYRLIVKS